MLKIVNQIYILLASNHLSYIFAEAITIKTLFALAITSAIVDCRGEFWGMEQSFHGMELQEKEAHKIKD